MSPLPFIPEGEEGNLLIDIDRRISNIEGLIGKGLSHTDLKDIEDHKTFLRNDGSVAVTGNLDFTKSGRIKNSANRILDVNIFQGAVRLDNNKNELFADPSAINIGDLDTTGFGENEILFINGSAVNSTTNFTYDEDATPDLLTVTADGTINGTWTWQTGDIVLDDGSIEATLGDITAGVGFNSLDDGVKIFDGATFYRLDNKSNVFTLSHFSGVEVDIFTMASDGSATAIDTWTWTGGGIVLEDGIPIAFGSSSVGALLSGNGTTLVLDLDTNTVDFNVDTNGNANAFFIDESLGVSGFGTNSPGTNPSGGNISRLQSFYSETGALSSNLSGFLTYFETSGGSFATGGSARTINPLDVRLILDHTSSPSENITAQGANYVVQLGSNNTGTTDYTSIVAQNNIITFRAGAGSVSNVDFLTGNNIVLTSLGSNNGTQNITEFRGVSVTGSGAGGTVNITDGRMYYAGTMTAKNTLNTMASAWFDPQTNGDTNYGLVLNGDGAGSDIVLGAGQENRIYTTTDASEHLVLDTTNGAGKVSINNAYDFPNADGNANDILVTDGAGTLTFTNKKVLGVVHPIVDNFISGTGSAGTDNTAETVETIVLPANALTQVGDRIRIRCYWMGDTGANVTGTVTVNGVTIADTTDGGGATFQVSEAWLHYIDSTHANIISMDGGAIDTTLSDNNVAGFDFTVAQDIDIDQDAAANNHIIVYFFAADIFPQGTTN